MEMISMEAKSEEWSWRKPEQICFCLRIYAIWATLCTNDEGAKTWTILCANVRNQELQWWQAAHTHMPPLLHLSNIASFLKFPSTTAMASWVKAHQFCSSYTLSEQLLSNRLDHWERRDLWICSSIKISNPARCEPAFKSVIVLLFQYTDTSVGLSDHSTHWGLIRATRCARL